MNIYYNQLGYKENDKKYAYVVNPKDVYFEIIDLNGVSVLKKKIKAPIFDLSSGEYVSKIDFSEITKEGKYLIKVGEYTNAFLILNAVYINLYNKALEVLELAKCGCEIKHEYYSHKPCHTSLATIYGTNKKIDVSGGMHDAGDYGRYTVPGAKVILDLLLGYLENKDDKKLELAEYEIAFLIKMQRDDGAVYHKVTGLKFPPLYSKPTDYEKLYCFDVSTQATGDFVAALGLYAYIIRDIDEKRYKDALNHVIKAYEILSNNNPILFHNPSNCCTGEYVDSSDEDERLLAKATMYLLTKDNKYLEVNQNLSYLSLGWDDMSMYAAIIYSLANV